MKDPHPKINPKLFHLLPEFHASIKLSSFFSTKVAAEHRFNIIHLDFVG
jgi:hypothetical protein